MSRTGHLSYILLVPLLALLTLLSEESRAAQAKVILTGHCTYMVLSSPQGQILAKRVSGPSPETGHVLVGDLTPETFSKLTNKATGQTLKVWVDLVSTHNNRALGLFGKYCR